MAEDEDHLLMYGDYHYWIIKVVIHESPMDIEDASRPKHMTVVWSCLWNQIV